MTKFPMTKFIVWILSVGLVLAGASSASGQAYPNKPIRLFAGEAGGATDFLARIIAAGISGPLGQPVVVENRSTELVGGIVAKSPPDGYTLFVQGSGLWITPLIQKTNYDAETDFSPVALLTKIPSVLVVNPSLPVKSVKELIALAKSKPGVLNYASGPTGTPPPYAAELFKYMAGVDIKAIPYRGTGLGLIALLSGEVQVAFYPLSQVSQTIQSGGLRALAVTSAEPSPLAPGLPTVAASGDLPGYEVQSRIGLWVPAKTPAPIVARLNQEVVGLLNKADVKEKIFNTGSEIVASTPEALRAAMISDKAQFAKLMKDVSIKAE